MRLAVYRTVHSVVIVNCGRFDCNQAIPLAVIPESVTSTDSRLVNRARWSSPASVTFVLVKRKIFNPLLLSSMARESSVTEDPLRSSSVRFGSTRREAIVCSSSAGGHE